MSDPTSLPNFPPPADEHPLRGRMLDVLTDLKVEPNIDADGDIAFQIGEPLQQMFVRCQDGDWPVMRIFGQWLISDQVPSDPLVRLQRCNDFTLQLNLAKLGIANDNLVVSVEHVAPQGADLSALFQISVNLVMEVVQMWHQSFLDDSGDSGDSGVSEESAESGEPGADGSEGSGNGDDYRPRHRSQDQA